MIKNSNDISKIYEKFPDQNPNPVMRSSETGDILYFNDPAVKIIQYWEQVKDRLFPKSFFDNVKKSKQKLAESSFEIRTDKKFFLVKSVYVEELKSYNKELLDKIQINKGFNVINIPIYRIKLTTDYETLLKKYESIIDI